MTDGEMREYREWAATFAEAGLRPARWSAAAIAELDRVAAENGELKRSLAKLLGEHTELTAKYRDLLATLATLHMGSGA